MRGRRYKGSTGAFLRSHDDRTRRFAAFAAAAPEHPAEEQPCGWKASADDAEGRLDEFEHDWVCVVGWIMISDIGLMTMVVGCR